MAGSLTPTLVHLVCAAGFYGAEKVVANLCNALPDIDTEVLCMAAENAELSAFRDQVTVAGARFVRRPNSMTQAFAYLQDLQSEQGVLILHAHGYKEIVIACLFSMAHGCRVVVTQHGFTERNVKSRLYNWIDKAFCRWGNVHRVVAVSSGIRETYRRFSVPEQRLLLLPNGILPICPDQEASASTRLHQLGDIKPDHVVIAYVGRFSAEKDPLLFIRAFHQIHQQNPSVIGLMLGHGPLWQQAQDLILELDLKEQLICPGFVDKANELFPAMDVLMITSQTEGTPMTVLEAMATGTVVVAASVGGLPELIRHGHNGMLVTEREAKVFAAAAITALTDVELHRALSQNARQTVLEHYDLHQQRPVYEAELYGLEQAS